MRSRVNGGLIGQYQLPGPRITDTVRSIGEAAQLNAGGQWPGTTFTQNNVAPVITTVVNTDAFYANIDDTAVSSTGGYVRIFGSGFTPTATVYLNGNVVVSNTVVSSNEIRALFPGFAGPTATLMVFNGAAGAIYLAGVAYSANPTWVTASGSVGTVVETTAVNNTLQATGDAPIRYYIESGNLPAGVTLNSITGVLSGTAPADTGSTTYTFVVRATDAQNQDSYRTFTLTINTDSFTWTTPAVDGTTYTIQQQTPMSNIGLLTTAASGSAVTYTANALPTGLTLVGNVISGTPALFGSNTTLITATATATTRTSTRVINWSITVAGDLYWPSTTLVLTANAAAQANSFITDSSINNAQLTVVGDTRAQSFNPFQEGYYSNFFNNATADYLSITASSLFSIPTAVTPFTIEAWVYLTSSAVQQYVFSEAYTGAGNNINLVAAFNAGAASSLDTAGLYPVFGYYNGSSWITTAGSTTAITINTWYHIAWVFSGTNSYIFINGVNTTASGAATTWGGALNGNGDAWYIGRRWDISGNPYYAGYISNFRFVKGTAVYVNNFTPTFAPLTVIPNTVLLACQSNRFIDNSPNNITLTKNGSPTVTGFNPFGNAAPTSVTVPSALNYSMYFDGNGDYLTLSTNTALDLYGVAWTAECWVNPTGDYSTYRTIFAKRVSGAATCSYEGYLRITSGVISLWNGTTNYESSTTLTANVWSHCAWVYTGTTIIIYVNGLQVYSSAVTLGVNNVEPLVIGGARGYSEWFAGYLSNFRIVKGAALYNTDFIPSTTPLAVVAPNSTIGYSTYFDGTGDYLSLPSATNLAFGTADFTLECWIYATAASDMGIYEGRASGSGTTGFTLTAFSTSVIRVYTGAAALISSSGTTYINLWTHVAVVRYSGTTTLYINGVAVGSSTGMGNLTDSSVLIGGGRYTGTTSASSYFTGYISNFRMVKGQALYTAAFIPSTVPLTTTSQGAVANNVVLLTSQSAGLVDNSRFAQAITRNGDTTPSIVNPFYANATIYTSVLTCQANTIVDTGVLGAPITVTGDAVPRQNGPFIATTTQALTGYEGSGYFDGTGDYLTLADSPNIEPLAKDFTVECWFYPVGSNPTNAAQLISKSNTSSYGPFTVGFEVPGASSYLHALSSTDGTTWGIQCISTVAYTTIRNLWNHVAYVRNGSSFKLYLNGVQVASATSSASLVDNTNSLMIGYVNFASTEFPGYISNVRYVVGQALYTSAFFPSYAPLTNVANTQLLTLQNRGAHNNSAFIDNSTTANLVTRAGNVTNGTFSPYGMNWSTYLNGSAALVCSSNSNIAAGTGDWCIEFFLNLNNSATGSTQFVVGKFYQLASPGDHGIGVGVNNTGYPYVFVKVDNSTSAGVTSTVLMTSGVWHHIAAVRTSGTLALFQDGVSVGTPVAWAANDVETQISIGAQYYNNTGAFQFFPTGYVSNIRMTKGTVPYSAASASITVPTTQLQVTSTTVFLYNSNRFFDSGIYSTSLTLTGNPQIQKFSPFNNLSVPTQYYSGYFNGSTDYLTYTAPVYIGTGNFTIECWVYWTGTSWGVNGQMIIDFRPDSTNGNYIYFGVSTTGLPGITSGANSASSATVMVANTWYHLVGVRNNGFINTFVNGVGTTPVADATSISSSTTAKIGANAFRSVATTTYWTGYISNLRFVPGIALYSGNFTTPTAPLAITQAAGTNIVALSAMPANGYSVYYTGSSYTDIIGTSGFSLASGDFTIECWIYITATPADQVIINKDWSNTFTFPSFMMTAGTNGTITFQAGSGAGSGYYQVFTSANNTISTFTWYHVAAVRIGNTYSVYVNGTSVAGGAGTGTIAIGANNIRIGASQNPGFYFPGYISNLRIVRQALYTGSFPVPTTPLSLTQAAGSNTTALGIPANGFSGYFNGSSYLTAPATIMAFGGNNFTVEGWVYLLAMPTVDTWPTNYASNMVLIESGTAGLGDGFSCIIGATKLFLQNNDTQYLSSATHGMVINKWYHLAYVRNGNTVYFYVNGAAAGTVAFAVNAGTGAYTWIGCETGQGAFLNGYISNLRVVNGVVVYNGNFTPSTTPLTITQSAGTNISALTAVPTNGASVYFNGSTDYLQYSGTTFGTRSFTVEYWFYNTGTSWGNGNGTTATTMGGNGSGSNGCLNIRYASSTTVQIDSQNVSNVVFTLPATLAFNTWYHFALVRSGTSMNVYLNGVSSGAQTVSTNYSAATVLIGRCADGASTMNWQGYLSNVRFVLDSALYTGAFVAPTAPLAITQTAATNVVAMTGVPVNGNSILFNGSTDYLTIPDSNLWYLGLSDFTIEFWVYFNALPSSTWMAQVSQYVDINNRVSVFFGSNAANENGLVFKVVSGGTVYKIAENDAASITMASLGYVTNTWYHVAITRTGTSVRGYINGVQKASATISAAFPDLAAPLFVGVFDTTPQFYHNGYISNLRWIKGVAAYTGAFTPSTTPLAATQSSGTNIVALSGIPTNGYSVYFNGSTDYLTTTSSVSLGIGTTDFTIELWAYFNSVAGWQNLFDLRSAQPSSAPTIYIANNSRLNYLFNSSTPVAFGPNPLLTNTWYHIAWVRSAGTNTMYVNGVNQASFSDSTGVSSSLASIGARQAAGASDYFNGYISNLRITKAQALYTGNFTVPTAPLALTQSSSSNVAAILGVPVNGNSVYFNGSTDYLTTPATPNLALSGDFTVECWLYPQALPAAVYLWGQTNSVDYAPVLGYISSGRPGIGATSASGSWTVNAFSSTTLTLNVWTHVAWVRSGNKWSVYINGVESVLAASTAVTPYTSTDPFAIGSEGVAPINYPYTGYISNFRVVKGLAVYTGNFTVANTALATTQTASANVAAISGIPVNGGSVYFGGGSGAGGSYITLNRSINLGGSDFTWEAWVNLPSFGKAQGYVICGQWSSGNGTDFSFSIGSTGLLSAGGLNNASAFNVTAATPLVAGRWSHVAVVRSGSSYKLYINGVNDGSTTNSSTITNNYGPFNIGDGSNHAGPEPDAKFLGYMHSLRVVVGTAVYTTNFTPPTGPLSLIANTQVLACQGTSLVDLTGYGAFTTVSGTVVVSNSQSPFGNTAALLTAQSTTFIDNSVNNFSITTAGTPSVIKTQGPFGNSPSLLTAQSNATTFIDNSVTTANITAFGTPAITRAFSPFGNTAALLTGQANVIVDSTGVNYIGRAGSPTVTTTVSPFGTTATLLTAQGNTIVDNSNNLFQVAATGSARAIPTYGPFGYSTALLVLQGNTYTDASYNSVTLTKFGTPNIFANASPFGNTAAILTLQGNTITDSSVNGFTMISTGSPVVTRSRSPFGYSPALLTLQDSTFIDNSLDKLTLSAATTTVKPLAQSPFTTAVSLNRLAYNTTTFSGSMYFDGTGDYVSSPYSKRYALNGDFTIECWIYWNSASHASTAGIISCADSGATINGWQIIFDAANNWFKVEASNAVLLTGNAFSILPFHWTHIAFVRSGTACAMYYNGITAGTGTSSATFDSASFPLYIGVERTVVSFFLGYISDVRITNGAALYKSNFYPGTTPLVTGGTVPGTTASYNSTFILNGTAGGAVDATRTVDFETVGDAKVTPFSPYNGTYYSTLFNGSSDYLSIANNSAFVLGSNNFTIEAWIYPLATPSSNSIALIASQYIDTVVGSRSFMFAMYNNAGTMQLLFQPYSSSTATVISQNCTFNTGEWIHVAAVRSGTNITLYRNGVALGTTTYSSNIDTAAGAYLIGARFNASSVAELFFNGYISNHRFTKGQALYTTNFVPSTTPLTTTGQGALSTTVSLLTCQSNRFVDNSANGFALTLAGTPKVQTLNPFQTNAGTGISYYFDGTGDRLITTALNQNFKLGSGNFTVEAWVYLASSASSQVVIVGQSDASTVAGSEYIFYVGGAATSDLYIGSTSYPITSPSPTANTWAHVAWVRNGTSYKSYLNGVQVGSTTLPAGASVNSVSTTYAPTIGAQGNAANQLNGYITDFRLTKGLARYTSGFTPPTTPLDNK